MVPHNALLHLITVFLYLMLNKANLRFPKKAYIRKPEQVFSMGINQQSLDPKSGVLANTYIKEIST